MTSMAALEPGVRSLIRFRPVRISVRGRTRPVLPVARAIQHPRGPEKMTRLLLGCLVRPRRPVPVSEHGRSVRVVIPTRGQSPILRGPDEAPDLVEGCHVVPVVPDRLAYGLREAARNRLRCVVQPEVITADPARAVPVRPEVQCDTGQNLTA